MGNHLLDASLQRALLVGGEKEGFDRDCHAVTLDWTYRAGNLVWWVFVRVVGHLGDIGAERGLHSGCHSCCLCGHDGTWRQEMIAVIFEVTPGAGQKADYLEM